MQWTWNTLLTLLIAIAVPQGALSDEPKALSIATYNICWGNVNLPLMLETIRQADADVVCLQETTARSEVLLRQQLKDVYPNIRFSGHNGPYAAERFGVLSKLRLAKYRFHWPPRRFFGFVTFSVSHNSQAVNIVNVHLAPFTLQRPRSIGQLMQQLSNTELQHKEEIEAVIQFVDTKTPTILAGDFNSMTGFAAPRRLQDAGFTDSFAAVTESPAKHPTWFWPLRTGTAQLRIDYIFHSPHFQTVSSHIDPANASDHRLLLSKVKLVSDHSTP
ncbi:endonuclease/exonuclease/phosphatase family protein [Fuerstiella marisgermanici]|uniref:Exodeoxyribonuclease III (Xth) n=1 Tax=Fuerstiella marisgermanici TaxID=1891926 RepID=A0A1P8WSE4_9PLAN|nr:endonuclease/exonuclease/phosphatase family protein [Fuerstiella marisgermanici]APZ96973.1 exodeoxyribonuclease III (xth) [Fuerstiella marisgermanici]